MLLRNCVQYFGIPDFILILFVALLAGTNLFAFCLDLLDL
jgi:hypothetical protein